MVQMSTFMLNWVSEAVFVRGCHSAGRAADADTPTPAPCVPSRLTQFGEIGPMANPTTGPQGRHPVCGKEGATLLEPAPTEEKQQDCVTHAQHTGGTHLPSAALQTKPGFVLKASFQVSTGNGWGILSMDPAAQLGCGSSVLQAQTSSQLILEALGWAQVRSQGLRHVPVCTWV